jgi:flotillin
VQIAQIEAKKKSEMREAELQKDVELRRALVLQEKQRAEKLSVAVVESEIIKTLADANLYRTRMDADGKLYQKQRDADAIRMLYDAQANGLQLIHSAFKGDNVALLQYLMLEKGLYVELAKANAEAIKGLEPKITVWNTGSSEGTDGGKAIRDIFQSLPPLLSTINQQTGIEPPSWLAKVPAKQEKSKPAIESK